MEGPTRSNFPSTSNAGAAASGEASFSTYLQTANVGGGALPAHQNGAFPSEKCLPRSCARSVPWFGAASGAPPSERTFRSPRGTRFRVREGFCKSFHVERRVAWALCGPLLVSSTGDAGCSENVPGMSKCSLQGPRLRMLLASDSRSVVMKVDTCSEVCNNSPAKASGSENEWHSRVLLIPSQLRYVDPLVVARFSQSDYKAETQSCRRIPRGTFSDPPSGGEERGTDTVLAKAWAEALLRADLGCSSSYSSEKAKALNLLENRSVEEGFLPTAVEQE